MIHAVEVTTWVLKRVFVFTSSNKIPEDVEEFIELPKFKKHQQNFDWLDHSWCCPNVPARHDKADEWDSRALWPNIAELYPNSPGNAV